MIKDRFQILEEKFIKHYPKTMQTIKDALSHMVTTNTSEVRAAIFMNELPKDYEERVLVVNSFRDLMFHKGYACGTSSTGGHISLDGGNLYHPCVDLYLTDNPKVRPLMSRFGTPDLYTKEKPFKLD